MPRIQVGEVNLNYDIAGKGEPLLMIMGLGASSAAWDPELIAELARTFRVITFDNRGTGQSDKPDAPYSIEMFADDAAGLLTKLDVPRAHIFGVSMGGMITQEFGLRPQREPRRSRSDARPPAGSIRYRRRPNRSRFSRRRARASRRRK